MSGIAHGFRGPGWLIMILIGKGFSSEDYIDSTTVFGGIHKNIISKNFKGGDIVVFMGGTKIIIPSNWEIRNDVTSFFESIGVF